jgi:hypothetical protein
LPANDIITISLKEVVDKVANRIYFRMLNVIWFRRRPLLITHHLAPGLSRNVGCNDLSSI